MKKQILKMIEDKEAKKAELGERAKVSNDVNELKAINAELETLNEDIANLKELLDELPDEDPTQDGNNNGADDGNGDGNSRAKNIVVQRSAPQGQLNVLGTYGINQPGQQLGEKRSGDKYGTPEYRSAFMNYVTKGKKVEGLEFRADETTKTTDIGAVIPSTIMNQIIEKMKAFGMIWDRVTKVSVSGGLELPISSVKPVATWVNEGSVADKQKKTAGKVSFSYHKLQIRVSVTLESDIVALPIFEQAIADNISEAMVIGLESSIISGSGTGQPLGIIKDTGITADKKIAISVNDIGKYATWTDIISKIPLSYEAKVSIIITKVDWDKYILGMMDAQGQPIARVNYGLEQAIQRRLFGYEVILVEEYLPTITKAANGDVWGIICNLSDYIVNSNMQVTYKRYFDENTDEWISKSTLICDGKLGDKEGVLLLTKGPTT